MFYVQHRKLGFLGGFKFDSKQREVTLTPFRTASKSICFLDRICGQYNSTRSL